MKHEGEPAFIVCNRGSVLPSVISQNSYMKRSQWRNKKVHDVDWMQDDVANCRSCML